MLDGWNHVLWYSLQDGLISFGNIHLTGSIHVFSWRHNAFLFTAESDSITWVYHFLHSAMEVGEWSCCESLSTAVCVHVSTVLDDTETRAAVAHRWSSGCVASTWQVSWMLTANAISYSAVPQWTVIRESLDSTFAFCTFTLPLYIPGVFRDFAHFKLTLCFLIVELSKFFFQIYYGYLSFTRCMSWKYLLCFFKSMY